MSEVTNFNQADNAEQTTERVPMVFRIMRVPKVLWEEEIVPMMQQFEQEVPTENFNVYKWMIVEKFVKEATTPFFLKLLATCLLRAGMEINLINKTPVLTLTTAEDEDAYNNSMEIIHSMMRFRQQNPDYIAKQQRIMRQYPQTYTSIKDVR